MSLFNFKKEQLKLTQIILEKVKLFLILKFFKNLKKLKNIEVYKLFKSNMMMKKMIVNLMMKETQKNDLL